LNQSARQRADSVGLFFRALLIRRLSASAHRNYVLAGATQYAFYRTGTPWVWATWQRRNCAVRDGLFRFGKLGRHHPIVLASMKERAEWWL